MIGCHLNEAIVVAAHQAGDFVSVEAAAGEAHQLGALGKADRGIDRLAQMVFADREQVAAVAIAVEHEQAAAFPAERAQRVDRGEADHEPDARMAGQLDEDIGEFVDAGAARAHRDEQRREIADRPQAPGGRAFAAAILPHAGPGRPEADRDGGDDQHMRPEGFAERDPDDQRDEAGGDADRFDIGRLCPARPPPQGEGDGDAAQCREQEDPALRCAGIDRVIGHRLDRGRRAPDQPGSAIGLNDLAMQAEQIHAIGRETESERDQEPDIGRHSAPPYESAVYRICSASSKHDSWIHHESFRISFCDSQPARAPARPVRGGR